MPSDLRFCELVGCERPLQLASLGGPIGSPELAAAVSSAGGLGMIPNPSPGEVEALVASAWALGGRPIGVGFLMPFVEREAVEAAARSARVVEFFYGDPDSELVGVAGRQGAVVGWQVGSSAEAAAAAAAGCGYVVAQGTEAGGHIRGTQPLDDVLLACLEAVDLPVVAAGGIGSADRVAALLRAGASAVRIGTRFVAARESYAHPEYVSALIAASASDTVITEAFGRGWSNAPHRVLRSAVQAAEAFHGEVVAQLGERVLPPFSPAPPTIPTRGTIAAMALYAGTSVDDISNRQSATEIVLELTATL